MLAMKRTDAAEGLANAAAYIRGHLNDPLDLTELADRAGFSRFHFHRVFRAVVGEPLAAYVRRERLQWAAGRLRDGGRDVTSIALEAGYETPSAFARAFREHYGVAPSAFRDDASLPIVPEHALPRFRGRPMDVGVIELPPRRLFALRHVGSYRKVGAAFERLLKIAGESGLMRPGTEVLGLSYDDPDSTLAEELRFDACITARDAKPPEPLYVLEHEGGRHAAYRHVGPYQLLEHVFDRLFDAVVFSGIYRLREAPCIEIYQNDPHVVEPQELITDVCIPIA
jgi:AraC family transcriptional regulator